ncbi:DUF3967 domain-containing protein [Virgibacillus flavescens]|uniref:DUF3967 domain-containing protein n=1 Tax=Virgibacillus flavescens TaxID=1611422 RepID=UPI003D32E8B7
MTGTKMYSTGEIAKRIRVEPVTVRKYAQMLEEKGYEFEKDQKGWRRFKNTDLYAFEHLATLRHGGLSVEESIESIASLYRQNLSILHTDTTIQSDNPLKNFIETQLEFNQKILERLDQQEKRQNQRDQNLINVMNQSLETQKQIASTQHKKWWKFWK